MIQVERLLPDCGMKEPPTELETADPRLEDASAAALRGDYLQAGRIAEAIYEQGTCDARVLGYLVYGALIERGPPALGLLLNRLARALGDGRSAFSPIKRRDVLLDGAMFWLLSKIVQQLEHADQRRSEAWQQWLRAAESGDLAGVPAAIGSLQPALLSLAKKPRAATPLLHLADLLGRLMQIAKELRAPPGASQSDESSFSSASTLQVAPGPSGPALDAAGPGAEGAAEPQPESGLAPESVPAASSIPTQDREPPEMAAAAQRPPLPVEAERSEPAPIPPRRSWCEAEELRAPAPPRPLLPGFVTPSAMLASTRLIQLAEQIQLFCSLLSRGQAVHAAVIGAEIQAALDGFDPRAYLPILLAPYFRALSRHSAELAPILSQREHLSFRALAQLYQVDPESFLAASGRDAGEPEDPE